MLPPYKPYIPKDAGEIRDLLGMMMIDLPSFADKTGYFPEQNIEHGSSDALNESLRRILE